jgi:hypothetical protein
VSTWNSPKLETGLPVTVGKKSGKQWPDKPCRMFSRLAPKLPGHKAFVSFLFPDSSQISPLEEKLLWSLLKFELSNN